MEHFEKAKKVLGKMGTGTSEHLQTEATIYSLEGLSEAIQQASSAVSHTGGFVNSNLSNLTASTNQGANAAAQLVGKLQDLTQLFERLNASLMSFDEQATKLGRNANAISRGLLIVAAVQAIAAVIQIWIMANAS